MGKIKYTEEFKRDAVRQVTDRGYPVAEVAARLGVSGHSIYGWMKKFSDEPVSDKQDDQSVEIRRLKQELLRITEERDILKKATVYFAKDATLSTL